MMKGGTHIIKVINKGVQQHYRGECTALSIASEISASLCSNFTTIKNNHQIPLYIPVLP